MIAPCLSYTLRSSSIKSDHDDGSSMSPSWTIKIGLLGRLELPLLSMRRSPDRRAAALPGDKQVLADVRRPVYIETTGVPSALNGLVLAREG